jgi:hypothetical protein
MVSFRVALVSKYSPPVNVQSTSTSLVLESGLEGKLGMAYPWPSGTGTSWSQVASSSLWTEPRFGLYFSEPTQFGSSLNAGAGEITLG